MPVSDQELIKIIRSYNYDVPSIIKHLEKLIDESYSVTADENEEDGTNKILEV